MSYTTRRGRGNSCPAGGSHQFDQDDHTGESSCVLCGFVKGVEAIAALEKDEDGNLQKRTADHSLGSLVDKKSHLLERMYSRYDSKPKISRSMFENEMRILIQNIYADDKSLAWRKNPLISKSASSMHKNLKEMLRIKRQYSSYIVMQTNSFRKGDQILFLRPGGRDSGNHLCALILTHHFGKLLDNWNANISVSEKEVMELLSQVKDLPKEYQLTLNAKARKTIRKDLKGLKQAWRELSTVQEYRKIIPPRPRNDRPPNPQEMILQIYKELFDSQNNEFDSMIYGIDSSLFDQFKIPQARSSLRAFIWEVERLRKGLEKSEMKKICPLDKYATKSISEDALFFYNQLTK